MFSTYDGARKRAKKLKLALDDSGFEFPLHKCQDAVAKAGGYRDWNDLGATLRRGGARAVEPEVYTRRLIRALPDPCTPAVLALLEDKRREPAGDGTAPPYWWHDVFPYVFAIAALHRGKSAILRPGSGPGQKLREDLVVGLLLNRHGGHQALPTLDPESLALRFRGDLATLFHEDAAHPRFEVELAALVEAGVIALRPNGVVILPPDPAMVGAHVLSGLTGKAEYSVEQGGKTALDAIANALSAIGIRNASRMAEAIVQYGSKAFTVDSGPALTLLSDLAEEGDIDTFAKAAQVFQALHPASAATVRASIPAKISSFYFARYRGFEAARLIAYTNANPDWAERLRQGVANPAGFAVTVDKIAQEIETG